VFWFYLNLLCFFNFLILWLIFLDPGGHHDCGGGEGAGQVPAHRAGPAHQEQRAAARRLPHAHQRAHFRARRPGLQVSFIAR